MKNVLIYLTVFALVFTSCSNEEEDMPEVVVENVDPIVGTWQLTESYSDEFAEPLDDCELNTEITFFEDGSVGGKSYSKNASGDCELALDAESQEELAKTVWRKISDNEYEVDATAYDPDYRVVRYQVEFDENKMTLIDNFEEISRDVYIKK